ncbi:hypothetical protein K7X08_002842 [Anisodus acutangulus]|uniref:Uncharacterized protein n=1 Tax=Anisodus acutangulus TaxID=402998 RepID=A0A9Q1RHD3_9SOLA|nr:hypothetical protein K7X08_002842 [Anisodus acutangulus]
MPAGGVAAAKALATNSKQGEKEFFTEVTLLEAISGRSSAQLLGEEQTLSWEERLQIALDVSHGIEYLHDGYEGCCYSCD